MLKLIALFFLLKKINFIMTKNTSFNLKDENLELLKTLPHLSGKDVKYVLSLDSAQAHQEMQHLQACNELLLL